MAYAFKKSFYKGENWAKGHFNDPEKKKNDPGVHSKLVYISDLG